MSLPTHDFKKNGDPAQTNIGTQEKIYLMVKNSFLIFVLAAFVGDDGG